MKNVRLIPVVACATPFVIFGVIYALAVEPNRAAEQAARTRAESVREELVRAQSLAGSAPVVDAVAEREFERRTPAEGRVAEDVDAIRDLLKGPAVGGVRNLSIETGAAVRAGPNDLDPRIRLFTGPIAYAPLTVNFDARHAQLGLFLENLRTLPSTFELRAVDVTPLPSGAMVRARLELFLYQRSEPATPPKPAARGSSGPLVPSVRAAVAGSIPELSRTTGSPVPQPEVAKAATTAGPAEPDPVVHTILFSSQHRVALVDDRIVRPGDRLGSGVVIDIERNAVVFMTATGLVRHLPLDQPTIGGARQ
jgi:hypothetical protein